MYQKEKVDMRAFGQAVKEAREKQGLSRESLAEMLELSPRYVMYVETRGQHTSLQKLYEIATLFSISVDQFFFPDTSESKSTIRRQLDAMLDNMDEKELLIVTGTAEAIDKNTETGE
jgi:transcriptional regulator with XRE-family HTH domain